MVYLPGMIDMPVYAPPLLSDWPDVLGSSDEVIVQEWVDGLHGAWMYEDGALRCVGDDLDVAERYRLIDILRRTPRVAYYGVVFGQGQLGFYDAYDAGTARWLDFDEFIGQVARVLRLGITPIHYRGPWAPALRQYADGRTVRMGSIVPNRPDNEPRPASNGVIIRPVRDRYDKCGRVCFRVQPALASAPL